MVRELLIADERFRVVHWGMSSGAKSFVVAEKADEASRKFDYFVTGATGAMVSYLLNELEAEKLGLNYFTLSISCLLLLMTSAFFGFRRLEIRSVFSDINSDLLEYGEAAGRMTKLLTEGKGGYCEVTGGYYSLQDAEKHYEHCQNEIQKLESHLEEWGDKAFRFYHLRNRFLVAGFLSLVLVKIVEPYL